ncbi:MAG: chemotaxis protein CheW [Steroidobacteraceae bacterium]
MSEGELYALLLPLAAERLLVPRACVAEVAALPALQPMPGAPAWYLGIMAWNGRSIPVVSFEGACGQPLPGGGGRSRVVIFSCLGRKLPVGYFGVVTQGFPQLLRISPNVITADDTRVFGERSPVLCQVKMVNELPLVPDLERLEDMIADETTVTA